MFWGSGESGMATNQCRYCQDARSNAVKRTGARTSVRSTPFAGWTLPHPQRQRSWHSVSDPPPHSTCCGLKPALLEPLRNRGGLGRLAVRCSSFSLSSRGPCAQHDRSGADRSARETLPHPQRQRSWLGVGDPPPHSTCCGLKPALRSYKITPGSYPAAAGCWEARAWARATKASTCSGASPVLLRWVASRVARSSALRPSRGSAARRVKRSF